MAMPKKLFFFMHRSVGKDSWKPQEEKRKGKDVQGGGSTLGLPAPTMVHAHHPRGSESFLTPSSWHSPTIHLREASTCQGPEVIVDYERVPASVSSGGGGGGESVAAHTNVPCWTTACRAPFWNTNQRGPPCTTRCTPCFPTHCASRNNWQQSPKDDMGILPRSGRHPAAPASSVLSKPLICSRPAHSNFLYLLGAKAAVH